MANIKFETISGPYGANIEFTSRAGRVRVNVTVEGTYDRVHSTHRVAITRWVIATLQGWRTQNPQVHLWATFYAGDGFGPLRERMGRKFGFKEAEELGLFRLRSLSEEKILAQEEAARKERRAAMEARMAASRARREKYRRR